MLTFKQVEQALMTARSNAGGAASNRGRATSRERGGGETEPVG
jgi:hypothetical protein